MNKLTQIPFLVVMVLGMGFIGTGTMVSNARNFAETVEQHRDELLPGIVEMTDYGHAAGNIMESSLAWMGIGAVLLFGGILSMAFFDRREPKNEVKEERKKE